MKVLEGARSKLRVASSMPALRNLAGGARTRRWRIGTVAVLLFYIVGCVSMNQFPPLPTATEVDLERFSGTWYVIASRGTPFEREAYNAVEHYSVPEARVIETTFSFNQGSNDGRARVMKSKAFVSDESNAEWAMQFVWPFKAEYLIAYLDDDYEYTIIARSKRDYVWIMARTPHPSATRFTELLTRVEALGYDVDQVRTIPHAQADLEVGLAAPN